LQRWYIRREVELLLLQNKDNVDTTNSESGDILIFDDLKENTSSSITNKSLKVPNIIAEASNLPTTSRILQGETHLSSPVISNNFLSAKNETILNFPNPVSIKPSKNAESKTQAKASQGVKRSRKATGQLIQSNTIDTYLLKYNQ
jgi:hypothetical protein